MLQLPHVAPLTSYVEELRVRGFGEVPFFDPLDAGVNAKILFLFEKPGPMTSSDPNSKRTGSGFISRDNDDSTAEATFHFMQQAAIPRDMSIIWNVIPGWNGTIKVSPDELRRGAACVSELTAMLRVLQTIVFVGKRAAEMMPTMRDNGYHLLASPHPSPRVRAGHRAQWDLIPSIWSQAQ